MMRTAPACPRCHHTSIRRSKRQGLLERTISVIYVFPFRCRLCQHRFHALQWGARFERCAPVRGERRRLPVQTALQAPAQIPGPATSSASAMVMTQVRHPQAVVELFNEAFPGGEQDGWFYTPHAALDGDHPSQAMQRGNAEAVYRLMVKMVRWN